MKAHRITVFQGEDGRWYWRRQSGNNKVVASSEQGFKRRKYALRDAEHEVPADTEYYVVILP